MPPLPLEPPAPSRRIVAHVDMDAFYASVEVRENPALKGLPLIVGGDPKGGRGRGIVTTASYEARKFGVRSAMPISTAYRLCPHGVYIRPNFELYSAASERVFAVFRRHAGVVEAASIDEAYLDLTATCATFEEAEAVARAVQRDVREGERLSCSVGLAPNKLVAKIASDVRKPGGLTVVRPEEVEAFMAPLPVRRIPGVGPKTEEALLAGGLATCADLARAPPERLLRAFGSWGPRLAEMARGLDESPVLAEWERKSVGEESTFEEDVSDPDALNAAVDALARAAAERLAAEGFAARTVTLKVRTRGFHTFTRARTLEDASSDAEVFRQLARDLLAENFPSEPVRLLGVRLTGLTARATRQASLDAWPADALGEAEPSWTPPRAARRRWFDSE